MVAKGFNLEFRSFTAYVASQEWRKFGGLARGISRGSHAARIARGQHVPGRTHGYQGVGLASRPGSQQSSGGWRLGSLRLRMLEMENGLADLAALDSVVSAMLPPARCWLRAARSSCAGSLGASDLGGGSREPSGRARGLEPEGRRSGTPPSAPPARRGPPFPPSCARKAAINIDTNCGHRGRERHVLEAAAICLRRTRRA